MSQPQGAGTLPGVLASIVASKEAEVERLRARAGELEAAARSAPEPRSFRRALASPGRVALIAECKRRSPGAGPIRPDLDPTTLAAAYEQAGAAAISVLTDAEHFGGSTHDLEAVRRRVALPVLRKDFTIDALQVMEARAAGADAVLLIVRILTDDALSRLRSEALALGMSVLVEVHDAGELERALGLGADLVGINNRDLSTFTTDLDTTLRLLDDVPEDVVLVSESGIRTVDDVERLGARGVDAVLVGESLLRAPDPGDLARAFGSVARRARAAA